MAHTARLLGAYLQETKATLRADAKDALTGWGDVVRRHPVAGTLALPVLAAKAVALYATSTLIPV